MEHHEYDMVLDYIRSKRDGDGIPEKTLDQKIAIVRSFMHPGRLIEEITNRILDSDTVSIPVFIAASIEEAEDILDALEDDIRQLPDTIRLRTFNTVLFVDISTDLKNYV